MVTQTLTTTVANAVTCIQQYASIRNLRYIRYDKPKVDVPVRTESNPSPMKQSASNRLPGQSNTSTVVGARLNHELATGRYFSDDLADHIFGSIVSTALARDILDKFIADRLVLVFDDGIALDAKSDDVQNAINEAFLEADERDCDPPDTKAKFRARGRTKQNTFSFKWSDFPGEPIAEDELVDFLNKVIDRAFDCARHKLAKVVLKPNHRFATRSDKNRAMPLSYEPDGEDMRPDFLLLPAQAFSDDFRVVDPRYLNFTAVRLVGEAKNKDLAAGVQQVQRYMRGLRRAQPWVYYVLAMVITKDKAVLMRGEGSGEERLDLKLTNGRGCIEFIRILLGLALAEDTDLGQNPDIQLKHELRVCQVNDGANHTSASNAPTSATAPHAQRTTNANSVAVSSSAVDGTEAALDNLPISSRTRSASASSRRGASIPSSPSQVASASAPIRGSPLNPSNAPSSSSRTRSVSAASNCVTSNSSRTTNLASRQFYVTTSSGSSKRIRAEVEDDGYLGRQEKRSKVTETSDEQVIMFPEHVYKHTCLGLLFTSGSIRGRGTTVFSVLGPDDPNKRLALKTSWQDLERVADYVAVIKKLKDNRHANVIVPLDTFYVERNGRTCTTLGAIRGFLDEQINELQVENRLLSGSTFDLKRPVKYFWSVHDFVRGLRGALLGHQFLTNIGILHRDISENNIVLGVYPWEERGYLIDFDMAILQGTEEPAQAPSSQHTSNPVQPETVYVKGIRTGTFPYMSFGVLMGERHTHFDDVESFLYVLLLFFFSYAGSLSKDDLVDAHENGFVRPTGSGRLPHARSWPEKFCHWADGKARDVGESKYFHISHPNALKYLEQRPEIKRCLDNNWPQELQTPIRSLLEDIFTVFRNNMKGDPLRTEAPHAQFIDALDKWLVTYSELENVYSNCPDFKEPWFV